MKFTVHSPQRLFDKKSSEYAEVKLQRPILRHKLDDDNVAIRVDASQVGTEVDLRVAVVIPGQDNHLISCSKEELNVAIDLAADKLERLLRDLSDKKRSRRQNNKIEDFTEELGENDYLTDGEEEVLRDLGHWTLFWIQIKSFTKN